MNKERKLLRLHLKKMRVVTRFCFAENPRKACMTYEYIQRPTFLHENQSETTRFRAFPAMTQNFSILDLVPFGCSDRMIKKESG
jgi:hypothetical protein